MTSLTLRTCAKVNFCLRVLGRRTDGYHNIETVLQAVGLWDEARLTLLPGEPRLTLDVDSPDVPVGEANLCWRAASLLAQRAKASSGVAISLHKSIPVGAGLGGGSSDAAAVLLGLVRLWGLSLPDDDMADLANQLGADVPFFLHGGCCLAQGRGEDLKPLPHLPAWLVVVVPEKRMTTAQAYAALRRGAARGRRRLLTRPLQRTIKALQAGSLPALASSLHNDFEAAPMAGIDEARRATADLLAAGCLGASLSGSGSGAFGLAPDQAAAEAAASRLRASWPWVRVAPSLPPGAGLQFLAHTEVAS